jgi:triacylglycerol lipase
MKLNRRYLLWSGLGATIAAAFGRDHLQRSVVEAEQLKLKQLYDPTKLAQDAFRYDMKSLQDLTAIQQSAKLRSPILPYNREWSKLLIVGSKLCTQQYLRGKYDADYDGSIATLPLYSKGFENYQQITSFKAAERVEETIPFEVSASALAGLPENLNDLGDRVNQTKEALKSQVKQVVQLHQKISVYFGFLLTSPKANILMFRGTQRQAEWLEDVLAVLTPYHNPADQRAAIGNAHLGIYDFYKSYLAKPAAEAVKSLDPNKPLIVAGHSLGAGLATFAAMDLALLYPKLRPKLQLYAYAGPRVGDKAFVEAHSQLIPNHYRIINLADMIPLLPISKQFNAEFVHGGEQWSFLSYQGDILPNHTAETYRNAIVQEAETKADKGFDNLRVRLT